MPAKWIKCYYFITFQFYRVKFNWILFQRDEDIYVYMFILYLLSYATEVNVDYNLRVVIICIRSIIYMVVVCTRRGKWHGVLRYFCYYFRIHLKVQLLSICVCQLEGFNINIWKLEITYLVGLNNKCAKLNSLRVR